MEVISVCMVLEFSSPIVWENSFLALPVHCTIPGAAFEQLSDQLFLPQPSIALWKPDLALTPYSQISFMKRILHHQDFCHKFFGFVYARSTLQMEHFLLLQYE